MKLNKIKQIMQNPETLFIFIKSRDEESVRRYLSIKQGRKKMIQACDIIDNLLEKSYEIKEIIEIASKKTGLTKYPIAWYALVRKYKPEKIIETGVSMGWSSFMTLSALKRMKKGHLFSIDIDSGEQIKKDGGVGYLVTDDLKANWTLTIGDTKKHLGLILKKLKEIDMFVHDSDHSYEIMSFEYNLAWKYLGIGGIFCSDDINHSKAFDEFIKTHKEEIDRVNTFEEIERPSDVNHPRPYFGYLFKIK